MVPFDFISFLFSHTKNKNLFLGDKCKKSSFVRLLGVFGCQLSFCWILRLRHERVSFWGNLEEDMLPQRVGLSNLKA